MKTTLKMMIAALAMIGFSASALAVGASGQSGNASISVSLDVLPSATITVAALNMGSTGALTPVDSSAAITVNVSNGTAYNITLDKGVNTLHAGTSRRMLMDAAGLNGRIYLLYTDVGHTTEWGDSDFGSTYINAASLASTGTGADQIHTVYAHAFVNSNAFGVLSDTVTATIHY